MKTKLILALCAMALVFASCGGGGGTVVHSAFSEPADFMLSPGHPEVFHFTLPEDGKYSFEVEITYFSEQMQGTDALSLSYQLNGAGHGSEKKFSIPLKNGDTWLGTPTKEGSMDFVVKQMAEENLQLKKGEYEFHLNAETTPDKPILGMVKIQLNVLN
jgi:hypothetical protein